MILIIGGLGYGASIVKNTGLISFNKTQTFVTGISDKVSNKIHDTSDIFSDYSL